MCGHRLSSSHDNVDVGWRISWNTKVFNWTTMSSKSNGKSKSYLCLFLDVSCWRCFFFFLSVSAWCCLEGISFFRNKRIKDVSVFIMLLLRQFLTASQDEIRGTFAWRKHDEWITEVYCLRTQVNTLEGQTDFGLRVTNSCLIFSKVINNFLRRRRVSYPCMTTWQEMKVFRVRSLTEKIVSFSFPQSLRFEEFTMICMEFEDESNWLFCCCFYCHDSGETTLSLKRVK